MQVELGCEGSQEIVALALGRRSHHGRDGIAPDLAARRKADRKRGLKTCEGR